MFIILQNHSDNDGVCGELIDMLVADRLSIRIMEELMARDMWNQWTFSDFFGIQQITDFTGN